MAQKKPKEAKEADAASSHLAGFLLRDLEIPMRRDDRFAIKGDGAFLNRISFLATLNDDLEPWDAADLDARYPTDPDFVHEMKGAVGRINEEAEEFQRQLRMYVDEWLDTGVTNGIEEPRSRDLTNAPHAFEAIQRFAGKQRLKLEVTRDGFLVRVPQYWSASNSGENAATVIARDEWTAEDRADRILTLFWLSGWQLQLAKCRRADCGRYFWLNHWNRKFKRGILCPDCTRVLSLESAVLATAKTRKEAENELYRLAAKQFSKRISKEPNWHKDPKLRAAIIGFLNDRIKEGRSLSSTYPHGITGKWLSWSKNRRGIEKTANRETAKGSR